MVFETIRENTAPEMVIEQMMKKISAGEIAAGSRLPSQRDLALSFGVGRSSIREALNELAVMGYLDVQHGRGTFIAGELPGADPSVAQLKAALQAGSLLARTRTPNEVVLLGHVSRSGQGRWLKMLRIKGRSGCGNCRRRKCYFPASELCPEQSLASGDLQNARLQCSVNRPIVCISCGLCSLEQEPPCALFAHLAARDGHEQKPH